MREKKILEAVPPPKAPCLMEMSDINFGSPDQMFQSYHHSSCAERFHQYLTERTEIEAVATFAYGNLDVFPQMQLYLWVKDSAVTEQILQNTPHKSCRRDHPLFHTTMACLLDALQEDKNKAFSDVSNLWKRQQASDASGEGSIYVGMTILSHLRCYIDDLFGASRDEISQALAKNFPTYEGLICCAHSLADGPLAHNHLYLFSTPQDQEKAKSSGDIEKMRRLAFDILHTKDVRGYVSYASYAPQIANRRELTSEQIFYAVRE